MRCLNYLIAIALLCFVLSHPLLSIIIVIATVATLEPKPVAAKVCIKSTLPTINTN